MAPRGSTEDPKVTALRESRCLNPHPGQVTDPAFLTEEFFDARDAVQVKYEMVRRVSVDGAPVTATAAAFGYSRPSYYQAAAGLAVLTGKGVTAWRRALAHLTCAPTSSTTRTSSPAARLPEPLPGPVATEL